MALPNFILIGAMKAGTTSLARYLDAHPDVFVCKPKEPNFFADPGRWGKGIDWYQSLFPDSDRINGEASAFYTMAPDFSGAPHRMHLLLPEVRLLYLVRDPIERMRSMFVHRADQHREPSRSLAEAIETNPSYLQISRYDLQLEPYLKLFGEDRILVVTTDEMRDDPLSLLTRAFRHIGADPSHHITAAPIPNQGADKRRLGDLGYMAARTLQTIGARRLIPLDARRRIKRAFSSRIPKPSLMLGEGVENDLRSELARNLTITRRQVSTSGAPIPDWLAAQSERPFQEPHH